jgi:hypothetical protein
MKTIRILVALPEPLQKKARRGTKGRHDGQRAHPAFVGATFQGQEGGVIAAVQPGRSTHHERILSMSKKVVPHRDLGKHESFVGALYRLDRKLQRIESAAQKLSTTRLMGGG